MKLWENPIIPPKQSLLLVLPDQVSSVTKTVCSFVWGLTGNSILTAADPTTITKSSSSVGKDPLVLMQTLVHPTISVFSLVLGVEI